MREAAATGRAASASCTLDSVGPAVLESRRVQAPAKLQQQQKSAEKRERKERATERAKHKEAEQNPKETA